MFSVCALLKSSSALNSVSNFVQSPVFKRLTKLTERALYIFLGSDAVLRSKYPSQVSSHYHFITSHCSLSF